MRIAAGTKKGPTETNLTAMMLDMMRLVTKAAVMAGNQRWRGIFFYPSGCRPDMPVGRKIYSPTFAI
jgi:hypothetical protein